MEVNQPEDDKSFLAEYWPYIVTPIVVVVIVVVVVVFMGDDSSSPFIYNIF